MKKKHDALKIIGLVFLISGIINTAGSVIRLVLGCNNILREGFFNGYVTVAIAIFDVAFGVFTILGGYYAYKKEQLGFCYKFALVALIWSILKIVMASSKILMDGKVGLFFLIQSVVNVLLPAIFLHFIDKADLTSAEKGSEK